MRRFVRLRWPFILAAGGVALVTAAAALALAGGDARLGPDRVVQIGGRGARHLLRAASTPVLAVDPRDQRRLLLADRVEEPRFTCEVFHSSDGGATWRSSALSLPRTGKTCYAPSVGFDARGTAYLFLQMLAGPGNHPVAGYLYRSRDGGASFGPPRRVLPRSAFGATMAVGADGTVALASLDANEFSSHVNLALGPPPNPLTLRVSSDGGRSWAQRRAVHSPRRERVGGPSLAFGPAGELYVLYWDWRGDIFDYHAFPGRYGGHFELVLSRSRDGGRTFEEHVVERRVVPARPFLVYLPPLPALAVDGRTGTLYAAWEDARSGTSDLLLRRSRDGGATWSAARLLVSGRAHDLMPALDVAPDGRILAAGLRLAAAGRGETVARVSSDDGATFSAPVALTPSPFDARLAPRLPGHRALPDLGSALAASAGDTPLVAWPDTRAASRREPRMDILLARVPSKLPDANPLPLAPTSLPPQRSRPEGRLTGPCRPGPRVDSRASPGALLQSFVSALDRRHLRRAYAYLDATWKAGREPASRPHPFSQFRREFGSLTCARVAKTASGGEAGWRTTYAWIAVRRGAGPTRLLVGTFWARVRPEGGWTLMGYWTDELAADRTVELVPEPLASTARRVGLRAPTALERAVERTLESVAVYGVTPPRAARALALVTVAIRDAVRAAPDPEAAVEPAAEAVLSELFPPNMLEDVGTPRARFRGPRQSVALGRRAGARLADRGRRDGADMRASAVEPPSGTGRWVPTSAAFVGTPLEAGARRWRTWVLRSASHFRPPRPPGPSTAAYAGEIRSVYAASRRLAAQRRGIADFWADGPGTLTPAGHWNAIAIALIRSEGLDLRAGTRVLALLNMAQADAFIACWDAKYTYWTERPVTAIRRELDPSWRPYLQTPPFPSYPSGHACTSGAASEVLARFFPRWARHLRAWAREAAASRVYAGIHFPMDSEAGLALGRKVGRTALERGAP